MKNLIVIFLIFYSINAQDKLEPLTQEDMCSLQKLTGYILSPDGKYLIYGVKQWNKETGKIYTHLQYKDTLTNEVKILTPNIEEQSDSSPQFSKSFPNYLFFQRSKSGENSGIYYIEFPPSSESQEPVKLTDYVLSISEYKIKSKTIAFNTDMYFSCENMNCTKELIDKEKKQNYQVYNKLFLNHWDTWQVEGKGSHIFIQYLDIDESNKIILIDEPKDITLHMELNSPPLFTDSTNFDLSNNGKMVAFTGHLRDSKEALTTGWKTYFLNLETMANPILITGHTEARTQYPVFSLDDSKIAYLAMRTPGLESEFLHFEIYNILTNKISIISNKDELYIESFLWSNDHILLFEANTFQVNKLFTVDIYDVENPIVKAFSVKYNDVSYTLPVYAMKNKNIFASKINAYDLPDKIELFSYNEETESIDESEFVYLNEEFLKNKFISEAEPFSFKTEFISDTVYGFFFRPIDFNSNKTYPVVLLVHGGPEASFYQAWGARWDPQMYASHGYAVIMMNPHGSVGFGDKYQDAVRNDWGGQPFKDIIIGVTTILNKYPFLDRTRMAAAGGSYGGYMMNWIEGHNEIMEEWGRDWTFNCLANHDGLFSHISMFYATEEVWFPKEEFCDRDHLGCNPWEGPEIRKGFDIFSPERYVKNWHTPMLVIHGGTDYRVHITEGLSTFTSLQLRGIDSEFLFLHQENHWVLKAENQIKWYERVLNFFDKYTASGIYSIPPEEEIYKIFNPKYKL